MGKILEMRGITKKFPGVLALDDVSFEAYTGEILALCGENGAGKSTLMKILSGSYPADSYVGEIMVDQKPCRFMNTAQSEKAGIAMIYQEISMHLDETVAENVWLGRWPQKRGLVDWQRMKTEAEKYIGMVGLSINVDVTLRSLNTSEQQMVAIARALSKNPRILVLDEPTSPLTSTESKQLFDVLHQLTKKGIACILISHKLDEIFANADRITVLRDGKSISSSAIADANEETIVSEMVGRKITSYYPKEEVPIGDIALEVRHFTVPHPYTTHKNIVEDVSFSVRSGEILGIAGLVGAGRSELVNAVFGVIHKSGGEVLVQGKPVQIQSPADAISHGIALVTEERKKDGLVAMLSIQDNMTLASLYQFAKHGVLQHKHEKTESDGYFKRLNIKAPGLHTLVSQLSGGNQQKVVLGKWLMRKPTILILDEPTRGIDVGAKHEIYRMMVDLARQGIAIVMISSELPELISMSDRVIVISKGTLNGEMMRCECTQEKIMMMATGMA